MPLASSHKALRITQEFPNEIVQQIFAVFATTLSTEHPAHFPWFLGHICSTWRYLFLSMTTEFWHRISIKFSEKYECTVNVVRFFLQRSPMPPFSFTLMSAHDFFECNPEAADCICQTMEMLVDESMCWKEASFFDFCAQDLLPLIRAKNHLPLLQHLGLWLRDSDEEIPKVLYDIFQNAPSLDVVSIRFLADWKFNLLGLTDFSVYELGSGASNFFAALPQMTKLERLQLDCTPDRNIPSDTIVLPNLTSLSCEVDLLRFLQAPALEQLFVNHEKYDSNDLVSSSFLCRSSCGVKISYLGIASAQASTVIEIMKYTPQIVHLDLMEILNVGDVFKQLTIPANFTQESLVARHLRSLRFGGSVHASDYDVGLLSDLILSRTISNTSSNCGYKRLQTLEMFGLFFQSLDAPKKIIMLCEERGVQYIEE